MANPVDRSIDKYIKTIYDIGMLELLVYIFLLFMILLVFGTAAYAGMRASPWVPVFKRDIERVLKLADVKDNDMVYDLGSGDGRIVIAIAHNSQASVVGFEISFLPYLWSKLKILFLGLPQRVEVRFGDFLSRDLSQASVIFCFLTPMAMKKLSPKFRKELKKGTRIISYSFKIPDWEPTMIDRLDKRMSIYKYVVD